MPQSLERVLYVWAIRHPASGYVQGINDLAVPFYAVFLNGHIGEASATMGCTTASCDPPLLPPPFCLSMLPCYPTGLQAKTAEGLDEALLQDVEADVYWCLTRLVDRIQVRRSSRCCVAQGRSGLTVLPSQDHYTPSQPGIQRMIFKLRELTHRVDGGYPFPALLPGAAVPHPAAPQSHWWSTWNRKKSNSCLRSVGAIVY